jgi:hypothetical protein
MTSVTQVAEKTAMLKCIFDVKNKIKQKNYDYRLFPYHRKYKDA